MQRGVSVILHATLDEALEISEEDVIHALDGLPENKVHCSNLGVSALRNAIKHTKCSQAYEIQSSIRNVIKHTKSDQ